MNSKLCLLAFLFIPCSRKDFTHHPMPIVSPFSYLSHCFLLLNCLLFTYLSREATYIQTSKVGKVIEIRKETAND